MKKLILFAAVAGLGLVSAKPPAAAADGAGPAERRVYPPCSRTVTDSCMQRGERRAARASHARHVHHAAHARRIRMAGERG